MDGSLSDLMSPVMDRLEGRHRRGAPGGITTGLKDLDALTGGGFPGQMWVVNGPSGVGKTVFALGLARHVAIAQGATVQWLTTVEDPIDLVEVVLSAEARVRLQQMRGGGMTDDEWARLARRMGEVAEAPIKFTVVAEDALLEPAQALAAGPPSLLVVDSLPDALDRDTLTRLKGLTGLLGCWTIVVGGDREDLDPAEVDRAQAAARADVIMWLHREDQEDPDSPRAGEFDILITRSRATPTATITAAFQGHYGRVVDITG